MCSKKKRGKYTNVCMWHERAWQREADGETERRQDQQKHDVSLRLLGSSSSRSTAEKNILATYSTRNRKFKRLEPHFQPSATKSGMKENTKRVSAVALANSRKCTKELTSGLPKVCSQGTVELEQKWKYPQKQNGG